MQIDVFCNRESRKVIKGDIVDLQMMDDDGSGKAFKHVQVTLNTGYNILIELDAFGSIKRFIDEEMRAD